MAGRCPDILYETPEGTLRGGNIGRTRADGTPVTRETQALPDLNGSGGVPTGFEAWANKTHVDDYVEADSDSILAHGVLFSELLAAKLESLGRPFRVLLAVDLEAPSVTVRFFAHRPGEAWSDDDLETYRHEAILRWDVGETVR